MPTENPNLDSVRDIRKGPKKQLIDTFNQTNLDTQILVMGDLKNLTGSNDSHKGYLSTTILIYYYHYYFI